MTKKVKFPKKHKYGFRIVGEPISWFWIWRFKVSKKIFRPICWIKKHDYHIYWPYGVKIKICDRCGNIKYKKETTERTPFKKIYQGEVGELYGVRFVSSGDLHDKQK